MLPDDDAMRAVFLDGGVLESGGAKVHVNMATASLEVARELAAHHAARGFAYVAATVWGRPDVAAAGRLSIVAAGDPVAIAKVQPAFDVIGQKTYNVGAEPSRGNVTKIAGNLMVACARASPKRPPWCGATVCDMIGKRQYEPPGFDLVLGLKDVRLALAAAEEVSVPLPFASVLRDTFLDAIANGDAAKDWSAIARVAARRAGLEP